jgi:hypothetical protein
MEVGAAATKAAPAAAAGHRNSSDTDPHPTDADTAPTTLDRCGSSGTASHRNSSDTDPHPTDADTTPTTQQAPSQKHVSASAPTNAWVWVYPGSRDYPGIMPSQDSTGIEAVGRDAPRPCGPLQATAYSTAGSGGSATAPATASATASATAAAALILITVTRENLHHPVRCHVRLIKYKRLLTAVLMTAPKGLPNFSNLKETIRLICAPFGRWPFI